MAWGKSLQFHSGRFRLGVKNFFVKWMVKKKEELPGDLLELPINSNKGLRDAV